MLITEPHHHLPPTSAQTLLPTAATTIRPAAPPPPPEPEPVPRLHHLHLSNTDGEDDLIPTVRCATWSPGKPVPRSFLPAPEEALQFAALGFDVSHRMLRDPSNGGALMITDEAERRDGLASTAIGWRAVASTAPFCLWQRYQQLATMPSEMVPASHEAAIVTAGKRPNVTPAIARLFGRMPGWKLRNQYGPAETHVVTEFALNRSACAVAAMPADWEADSERGCVGARWGMQPVPKDVPGNCALAVPDWVAATSTSRLTAQRFIPHPFQPGSALYRSGDRAR